MSVQSARRKPSPHITVDVDLRDYIDIWDAPKIPEEDFLRAFDDVDAARRCLSRPAPDVQEALLRIERVLPLLAKAAK